MGSNKQATITRNLWEILSLLPSEPPGITATALFEAGKNQFDWTIGHRTFERYLDTLGDADLAVCIGAATGRREHVDVWRWHAHHSRNMESIRLSMNDALVYQLVKQTAERLLPPDVVKNLLDRITNAGQMLRTKRRVDCKARWLDRVKVIPDGFGLQSPAFDWNHLKALQRALLHQQQVRSLYQAASARIAKEAVLEPRALVQRGAALYIVANRRGRDQFTWYCLHRFRDVKVLEESVDPRPFDLEAFLNRGGGEWGTPGAPIHFKAWVDKSLAKTLTESALSVDMTLTDQSDGAIITATLHRSWAFERWLLGRGKTLQVIEPAELRAEIAKRLREAAEAYN